MGGGYCTPSSYVGTEAELPNILRFDVKMHIESNIFTILGGFSRSRDKVFHDAYYIAKEEVSYL